MNRRNMDKAWNTIDGSRPDWSAEERFVNRSIRIRKHVLKWLEANKGRHFAQIMTIAEECANEFRPFPCSAMACYRWINQFSAINAPFWIHGDDLGYKIEDRRVVSQ